MCAYKLNYPPYWWLWSWLTGCLQGDPSSWRFYIPLQRDIITTLLCFSCPLDPLFASNLDHHLVCNKLSWDSFWFLTPELLPASRPNITWDWSFKAFAINAIFFILSRTKPKMIWGIGTLTFTTWLTGQLILFYLPKVRAQRPKTRSCRRLITSRAHLYSYDFLIV